MGFMNFLVKWRSAFLAVMVAMAVVCGFMIPKINVIMEVTFFLPDDSPMKKGLDQMEEDFPGMKGQLSMLSVMLKDVEDKDAEEKVLNELTGGLILMSVKEKEGFTLYQYLLSQDCNYEAVRQTIKQHYDGWAVVEVDLDKNMPANIIPMIASGAVLVLIILLIMCSSLVEVFLFLFSMLIAVAINMGSNIILGDVSYMTHTMVAVLQMILSMDYSIIIMNRYRQEKSRFPGDNQAAMAAALHGASRSVLSSATTTIVSLLMLMFMELKVGFELGLVLSKGVMLSMVSNFLVLPALILRFDTAIKKTEKKIPQIPYRQLARFEVKNRAVLTVVFIAIFVASFILQKRTEISFSAIWETEIAKEFPPQNPFILLYETPEEDQVPGILDTLQRDPMVSTCISYPGLIKQGHTISELTAELGAASPMITEDMVRAVYYSYSHPERKERMSLNEIQDLAEELEAQGLMPEGFDVKTLMADLMPSEPVVQVKPAAVPKAPKHAASVVSAAVPDTVAQVAPVVDSTAVVPADSTLVAAADSLRTSADSALAVAAVPDSLATAPADSTLAAAPVQETSYDVPDDAPAIPEAITFEMVSEQLTARQLSERYGIERSYVNMLYRMAGRTRKPATMSIHEMAVFVNSRLLKEKRYSNLVTPEQVAMFKDLYRQVDSAFVAGPSPAADLLAQADTASADSLALAASDSLAVQVPVDDLAQAPVDDEPVVITPLERLAEMAFSGRRYNSRTMYRALAAARFPVTQSDIDLLYLYSGSRKWNDNGMCLSISQFVNYLDSLLTAQEAFSRFLDDDSRMALEQAKDELGVAATSLRSERHSLAAIMTDYPFESPETFTFVERLQTLSDRSLEREHVVISESAMYKSIKDGFPAELLLLTILTVLSIFIIVALTFKSVVVPIFLVMAVMSGVYVNVFVSGLNGNTMYFMAYLIVQSILMGATIDYSILFTSYYREARMRIGVPGAIATAFNAAGHSIMTSGLILTLAPVAMGMFIEDQMVAMILKCLATGAASALLIIFFILPGAIALCDALIAPKGAVKKYRNK